MLCRTLLVITATLHQSVYIRPTFEIVRLGVSNKEAPSGPGVKPEWHIPVQRVNNTQQPVLSSAKWLILQHNKPANAIWGNTVPTKCTSELSDSAALWPTVMAIPAPPQTKTVADFFFSLSNLLALVVCQRFSILLLWVGWVRGQTHASLTQTQQRLGFLGKVNGCKVMEDFHPSKNWCSIDVKVRYKLRCN